MDGDKKLLHRSLLGASLADMTSDQAKVAVQVIGPSQVCTSPPGLKGVAKNSGFPPAGCVGEEVRRDRGSFDYIVKNGLWSKAGLQAFYKSRNIVKFENNALEVKAHWIAVTSLGAWIHQSDDFVKNRFYTAAAQATNNGPTELYAMTSLHISVKAPNFPDWVWADFENAYTPGRCDQTGCRDLYGANIKVVPAKAAPWEQYGSCGKTPPLAAALIRAKVAPVFANYCLTGTQTLFTVGGKPTLLGSPIIEPLNADVPLARSSCISCHAGAAFTVTNGNVLKVNGVGEPIGPNTAPLGYKGNDFIWGLLFAS